MNKCKVDNCNCELFDDEFCIFHCEKDSWFEIVEHTHSLDKKTYRKWNINYQEKFWNMFYEYIVANKNCKGFIFPELNYYTFINGFDEDPIKRDHLSNMILENMDFSDSKFIEGGIIDNLTIKNCKFNRCKFEHISISFSVIKDSDFHGSQASSFMSQASTIEDSKFKWMNVQDLDLMFSHIYNSQFDSSSFNKMELIDTVVKDVSFQNIKIKKADKDGYRILKEYFFGISDNLKGNFYYSKEMLVYYKELLLSPYYDIKNIYSTTSYLLKNKGNKEKRIKNIISSFKSLIMSLKNIFTDGILLTWNFIVSNFGQNWYLPLLWLIVTSLVIFNYITPDKVFDINEFAMFLNPFIKNTDEYDKVYALWLLHKVLETAFLYSFVMAIKRKSNI